MFEQFLPSILILTVGFNLYLYTNNINSLDEYKNIENQNKPEEENDTDLIFRLKNRDNKVVDDPLTAPERRVDSSQYPKNKLYERTRGEPDNYQLLGILFNSEINKAYQLYGRRIYPGAYEWEYYIRGKDVGGLDFKYPLSTKQEIQDNSEMILDIDENTFTVKIYDYDQPRYNPFVLD